MKVFISHISEEKDLAFVFKKWIETSFLGKITVFVSSYPQSIQAGNKWREVISSALDETKILIILYSPQSITRPWINIEAGCCWLKKIPIIPICHSDLKLEQIGEPISSFQGLEINDKNFAENFFGAIEEHTGCPPAYKINEKHFLSEIKEALGIYDSTVAPTEESQSVKTKHKDLSETDILIVLNDYLKDLRYKLHLEKIRYSDVDDRLNLPSGSTKKYVKQVVKGLGYLPRQEGEEYITFKEIGSRVKRSF
ncbi:MAG: toll/interleukin-1 receptor domain-containing protein [Planctomycetes bacterium]|nr:toll/interleukin-1 receptor domain-containing protein [Planctomycetota bacterium]